MGFSYIDIDYKQNIVAGEYVTLLLPKKAIDSVAQFFGLDCMENCGYEGIYSGDGSIRNSVTVKGEEKEIESLDIFEVTAFINICESSDRDFNTFLSYCADKNNRIFLTEGNIQSIKEIRWLWQNRDLTNHWDYKNKPFARNWQPLHHYGFDMAFLDNNMVNLPYPIKITHGSSRNNHIYESLPTYENTAIYSVQDPQYGEFKYTAKDLFSGGYPENNDKVSIRTLEKASASLFDLRDKAESLYSESRKMYDAPRKMTKEEKFKFKYTKMFESLLDIMDFEVIKKDGKYLLYDRQLGLNGEGEAKGAFKDASAVAEYLWNYIDEYIIRNISNELQDIYIRMAKDPFVSQSLMEDLDKFMALDEDVRDTAEKIDELLNKAEHLRKHLISEGWGYDVGYIDLLANHLEDVDFDYIGKPYIIEARNKNKGGER